MSKSPHAAKLTANQVRQMREHYKAGESCATIAVWFNVSVGAAAYHTRDIRRPKVKKININRLEDMLADGLKQADISRALGVTTSAVSQAVRRLKARSRWHKMTARQVTELRGQYHAGARDVDLAEWFSITEATVRYHTRDIRRATPRRSFDHERARKLRDEGVAFAVIAASVGVSETSVRRALWRMERRAA